MVGISAVSMSAAAALSRAANDTRPEVERARRTVEAWYETGRGDLNRIRRAIRFLKSKGAR